VESGGKQVDRPRRRNPWSAPKWPWLALAVEAG